LFLTKIQKKKKKRKEICWGGSANPSYFFFLKKIKNVMGAFWKKKKVKVVELPQFESLSGGKVSHLKL
jgi:hypothetical protein